MDITSTINPKEFCIAIFASGAGSNAKKIIEHFRKSTAIRIGLIACNNPSAGVLQIAEKENIPTLLLNKKTFDETGYVQELNEAGVNFIVLAGFLWKVPAVLIDNFRNKMINIHPALLPKYGGKGMYGNFVHKAVIANNEKESGITIHFVDEVYDHGKIIFQAKCVVDKNDDASSLANKIHALEHEHYPIIIEEVLMNIKSPEI